MTPRPYSIHDNIHGRIPISEAERQIINTQTFQRLRKIRHLGLANLVFPGAVHTRFIHSLGVLSIMGRMTDTLLEKGMIEEKDVDKLRMAALLHDIGHYPLSHIIESVYKKRQKKIVQLKKTANTLGRLSDVMSYRGISGDKKYGHHERFGARVIENRDEIKNLLRAKKFQPEEIAKIINGEHKRNAIYDQLMHSGLDADRIDYLLRDSALTGVSYGQIDLDYLLSHISCSKDKKIIGISYKGQHAAEHYLLARYFMYSQVVFHKTVMGFEAIAKALFDILADEKIVYDDFEKLQSILNNENFISFTDDYFYRNIQEGYNKCKAFKNTDPKIYKKYYKALVDRKPLKLIREEKILYTVEGTRPEQYTKFVTRVQDNLHEALKPYKKSTDETLFYEIDLSMEKFSPYISIASYSPDDEMKKELVKVFRPDGKIVDLIVDKNSLIHYLSQYKLQIARLYVVDGNDAEFVRRFRNEVNSW